MPKKYIFFFIICLISLSCCTKLQESEDEKTMVIEVREYDEEDYIVGKKGSALFYVYDPEDFPINTKRDKVFTTTIYDEKQKEYTIGCGLWQHDMSRLFIFCEMDESFPSSNYTFEFNDTFAYLDFNITLYSERISIVKLDEDITDLYTTVSNIDVVENQELYEIKIGIVSYNNDPIFLDFYHMLIALNCTVKNNDLICTLNKERIEGQLLEDDNSAQIVYFSEGQKKNLVLAPEYITINFKYEIELKNIYIGIKKLLNNYADLGSGLVYETNITDFPFIFSKEFGLNFTLENSNPISKKAACFLFKFETKPLSILCWPEEGFSHLSEIKEEIVLKKINMKYKFRIQPVKNNENITVGSCEISKMFYSFPEILDFRSKDSLEFYFFADNPNLVDGITFNEESTDLECNNYGEQMVKCIVPKTHFKGKKNGYYFMKYNNCLNKTSVANLILPMNVILEDEGKGSGEESNNKTLLIVIICLSIVAVLIIVLIIYIIIRKKKNPDLDEEVKTAKLTELQ